MEGSSRPIPSLQSMKESKGLSSGREYLLVKCYWFSILRGIKKRTRIKILRDRMCANSRKMYTTRMHTADACEMRAPMRHHLPIGCPGSNVHDSGSTFSRPRAWRFLRDIIDIRASRNTQRKASHNRRTISSAEKTYVPFWLRLSVSTWLRIDINPQSHCYDRQKTSPLWARNFSLWYFSSSLRGFRWLFRQGACQPLRCTVPPLYIYLSMQGSMWGLWPKSFFDKRNVLIDIESKTPSHNIEKICIKNL
jgi:hypothetical protein